MKKLTRVGVVFATAVAAIPAVSFAAYVAAGQSIVLPAPQAGGANAYLAGETVNASDPVDGDLFAAGGTVIVSSNVSHDIVVVGGTVNMIGAAAEDVRVVGGNLTLGGDFKGEMMAAGGQIIVTPDATIVKDSYIAGGSINFMGFENGALTLAGGDIQVNGTVNGDLVIKRAGKVTIGPLAVIRGNFEYSAKETAVIEQGATITGATTFHQIETLSGNKGGGAAGTFFGLFAMWAIIKFIAILSGAYFIWYLRRKDAVTVLETSRNYFWSELLAGFAFIILLPVASIILIFTVIGAVPALAALFAYLAILVITTPLMVLFSASLVASLFKRGNTDIAWYHVALGAVALAIVVLVPLVGWLLYLVAYLVTLGSILHVLKLKFRGKDQPQKRTASL